MPNKRASVVVADDDAALTELLSNILGDEGYRVICRHSGKDAYEAIQKYKPVLAILDMEMEKRLSGLETVQMMRSNPDTQQIPVIVYSVNDVVLREHRNLLLHYQCQVLDKPFRLHKLLAMVELIHPPLEREV